uniref:Uncharacterized protein n=1 Tax=Solanum lycopersicum TaxID=4081 RepID=K4DEQ0_SOLLC
MWLVVDLTLTSGHHFTLHMHRELMHKANSSRRASRHQPNPLPVLAILAKDVGEQASKEKEIFSPILKRWHSFAA